jgi:hypothetical protein
LEWPGTYLVTARATGGGGGEHVRILERQRRR